MDNLLPYATVPLHTPSTEPGAPPYTADCFSSFIVPLPDKVYYPADAIEACSRRVENWLTRRRAPDQEPLQLRRYFITTVSKLREHAREHHTYLGDSLLDLTMHLETAQFVWIIEYCSVAQWNDGLVAARAIVDATASPTDEVPIWLLHDEEVALVFDRSSAEMDPTPIHLNRASSLSDFGSSIEYGFVAGGFGVGLRWGWFLPDRGGLPVLRRVAAWAG